MNTRLASVLCIALAAAPACKKSEKSGPAVARVGDEVITADEVRQRLNETSPFLRARYSTIERKKEFLENMVRNELLAQEAIRQGFDKSPAVREQMKRAMIQELIKRQLDAKLSGSDIPDEELKKFYDAHIDEFVKPERARVLHIFLPAKDAKERAEARKHAQALLKDIDAREKKGPVDTQTGVELVKLQVKTVAMNRGFDESKEPIRQRMARERRSRDYDEWVKKLRENTKVAIHEQELEKVQVDAAPSPQQPAGIS